VGVEGLRGLGVDEPGDALDERAHLGGRGCGVRERGHRAAHDRGNP